MPITLRCPSCSRSSRAPDHYLGKRVKCPQCKTAFVASAQSGTSPAPQPPQAPAQPPGQSAAPSQPQAIQSTAPAPPPVPPPPPTHATNPAPESAEAIVLEVVEPEPPRRRRRESEDYEDEEDFEDRRRRKQPKRRKRRMKRGDAASLVDTPATILRRVAGVSLVLVLILGPLGIIGGLINSASGQPPRPNAPDPTTTLIGQVVGIVVVLVWNGVIYMGTDSMRSMDQYGFALISCIMALFPCTVCWLGLPFGIWGLIILLNPDVRKQFR